MELEAIRAELDDLDRQLIPLLEKRLALCLRAGRAKLAEGRPIYDPAREQEKLNSIKEIASPDTADGIAALFAAIMEVCRNYEEKSLG